uniref:G-protein coupled receptors family 1 profile domain-containing protein n=1 Tax=Globodera rostochiensis TaxID=31243 RepID=A0A914GQQ5_GLORO
MSATTIEWMASVALPVLLGTINLLKALHTSTNSIVFSLTLSDFLLGCLILPFSIIQEFSNTWHFGTLLCKSWLSLDILLSTASIYNLLAISFDRYMAVKQPIKYGRLISSSRLSKFTISTVWLISAVLALPPFLSDLFLVTASSKMEMNAMLNTNHSSAAILELANTCTPVTNSDPYILFSAFISFILPMILMVALNVSIFCTVLDSKRKLSRTSFPVRSASAVSAGKQQHLLDAQEEKALRVHRGGSCRTLSKTGAPFDANWHHTISSKEKCHRSLLFLKKSSLGSNAIQHFQSRTKPTAFVHQQSLPSTAAFHASSVVQQNVSRNSMDNNNHHRSLPSSRKDTLDLSIAGGICGGAGGARGETFSTSLDSPKSSGGCTSLGGVGGPDVRKQTVRQIWLNRIKRIKMSQHQKSSSSYFCQSMRLWSSAGSCSELRCSSSLVNNMRLLMEHEHRLRSIAAVRKQRSVTERAVDRAVWFPAVVTSLFAGAGVKQSTTIYRRQSERLLLYPTIHQFAKNSLRTEMRVARTIAVVVGCFTCCWLPFTIIYVLQAFHLCPVGTCIPDWLFSVSFWLGYANSALNPLLYAAFSRDFRMAFRRVLMRDRNSSFRSSG